MKKAFGILVSLILWASLVFAQEKFIARASKTNVAVGEQFQVDFSVNANGERFAPPDLRIFHLVTGPDMETRKNLVNGDTTFDITYSYILAATKEGVFNIGAAKIVVNGDSILSNPIKINVKGQLSADQLARQQVNIRSPYADDNTVATLADVKNLPKQIFISAKADKTHAHVGENITVTYKLYTRVNIVSGQVNKTPALNGFLNQTAPDSVGQKIPWTTEKVNGLKYNVFIIKQSVLSPKHAGNLTIAPLIMATILQIPVKEGVLDNSPDNYRQLKYEVKSAPIVIHATALPSKSAKQGIKG